ncbi:MAG TPA: hypothetical protein DCF95_09460 [Gammaproteobacteria bacterium]|nr:hypothetical protein [Gammaproteobacteria bacterium]
MPDPFNLTALAPLYREAFERDERTLAFEVKNGRGRFLFLMFFDENDTDTNDQLFIYLRNIRSMLRVKLYGNHKAGQFNLYLQSWQEEKIKRELCIDNEKSAFPFNIGIFLRNLNASFPTELPLVKKIETLRESWESIRPDLPKMVVKEKDKTVLIGEKLVANGSPQEKTLRKLYIHTEGSAEDISMLIRALKAANMTVAWTTEGNGIKSTEIRTLINRLR